MSGKDLKLNCADCGTGLSFSEGEILSVNGHFVEVVGLDESMEAVRRLRLQRRKQVADELLARVRSQNDVPESLERQYRDALMDEHDRRYLFIM